MFKLIVCLSLFLSSTTFAGPQCTRAKDLLVAKANKVKTIENSDNLLHKALLKRFKSAIRRSQETKCADYYNDFETLLNSL